MDKRNGSKYAFRIAFGLIILVILLGNCASAVIITVPDEYAKIQWAIDNATVGDTIEVHSGNYYETVNVNKQLTLRGESSSTTIINGNGSGNIVEVTANEVKIYGFRIQNGSNGIYIKSNNNVISNNVIRDMFGENGGAGKGFGDSGGAGSISSGIYISGSTNNNFTGNTISNIISGTGGTGGDVGLGGAGGISSGIFLLDSTNNSFTINKISNIIGGTGGKAGWDGSGGAGGISSGIYLSGSTNNILTGNTMNNMIGGAGGAAEGPDSSGGAGGISSGIYISGSKNNILTGNNILKIIGGTGGGGGFTHNLDGTVGISSGIYISSSVNNSFTGNTISNLIGGTGDQNGVAPIGYSIYMELSSNHNKIYNNIFNNTNNIQFSGSNIASWNISKRLDTNIIGGSIISGNFWANPSGTGFSQICSDSNLDGICDLSYTIDSNNIDYFPLASNITLNIMLPAGVTNFTNDSYATNFINWKWTDPSEPGFDHVEIYLDGIFKTNVSSGVQRYTATNLNPNTQYTIGTKTVDTAGNVNPAMVTAFATTAADTTLPVITRKADTSPVHVTDSIKGKTASEGASLTNYAIIIAFLAIIVIIISIYIKRK